MISKCIIILFASAILAGCASIVCPSEYTLSISANVKNARVAILNCGDEIEVVRTPTEVKLTPKGGFFVPADYRFVFEKEGYRGDEVSVEAHFNWWYMGNIIFGGLIGMLIVDPATGAMWEISETSVVGSLKSLSQKLESIEHRQGGDLPSWVFQEKSSSDEKKHGAGETQSVVIEQIPL